MDLPYLTAVPIDPDGKHPAAALFSDALDWECVLLVSAGANSLAIAEEIARRCNQGKEQ